MSSSTVPTIGRVVWLWLNALDHYETGEYTILDSKQALKAGVVYVNGDGTVTLDVCDHGGEYGTHFNCSLVDYVDGIEHGHDSEESFATWMPYQMAQHAKQQAENAAVNLIPQVTSAVDLTLTDGKDV